MQGGSGMYSKGDKISVIKGDLTGLKGTVIAIEESGILTFKPMGIEQLEKPLQIEIGCVTKYFEPGDMVRVTESKYKGETGQVIDVEGRKVCVVLD
jgi:transcription elongation factor